MENKSNAAGIVGGAIQGITGLASEIQKNVHDRKYGAQDSILDTLKNREAAKNQLIQGVLSQQQAKLDAEKAAAKSSATHKKIALIAGGVLLLAGLVVGAIYYFKKHKKK